MSPDFAFQLLIQSVVAPACAAAPWLLLARWLARRSGAAAGVAASIGAGAAVLAGAATATAFLGFSKYGPLAAASAALAVGAAAAFGPRTPAWLRAVGWIVACVAAATIVLPTFPDLQPHRLAWATAGGAIALVAGALSAAAVRRDSLVGATLVLAGAVLLQAIACQGAGSMGSFQFTAALGAVVASTVLVGFMSVEAEFLRPAVAAGVAALVVAAIPLAAYRFYFEIGAVPLGLFPLLYAPLVIWGGLRGPWARSTVAPWVAEIPALIVAALLAAGLIWLTAT